jgi:virulence-associated protein VagC
MSAIKETTLFMNGRSQSLRIPAEMRLEGEKAHIQKIGNILIVTESNTSNPFLALDLAQSLISDDFMTDGRDLRPINEREDN